MKRGAPAVSLQRYRHFSRQTSSVTQREQIKCGGILFSKDMRYIVLVQNRYLYDENNRVSWGLPKGHIVDNETYAQCAIREIFEETGLSIRISETHPKLKINNTYYFPIQLRFTKDQLEKMVCIQDPVEILNIKIVEVDMLLDKRERTLNYECKRCLQSYFKRAQRIATDSYKRQDGKKNNTVATHRRKHHITKSKRAMK